jgi:hypothetical protein
MLKKISLIISLVFVCISSGFAQIELPDVPLKLTIDKADVDVGEIITLTITGNVPKDYTIYSSNVKCEIGPLVPEMKIEDTLTLRAVGGFKSVGDKIETDDIFNCQVGKFTKMVNISHKVMVISVDKDTDVIFEFQMCNEKSGICFNIEKRFNVALKNKGAKRINSDKRCKNAKKETCSISYLSYFETIMLQGIYNFFASFSHFA